MWFSSLTPTNTVSFHGEQSNSLLYFLKLHILCYQFVTLSENNESIPHSAEGNRSVKDFKWPQCALWEQKVLILGECNMCLLMTAKFKYSLPVWIPALTPLLSLKSIKWINFRTLIPNLLQPSCDMSEAWVPPQ